MSWDIAFAITDILQDEAWHFALSSISGFLAWLLILTMFSAAGWLWTRLSRASTPQAAKYFTNTLAFFCGLVAVWYSHTALDAFVIWFNSPMGAVPAADVLFLLWLMGIQ
jgi:hypothetical protein